MTKLFSMRSLAFAGAAAFALTLAAAPQADAAEVEKITYTVENINDSAEVIVSDIKDVNIVQGKLDYYYSSVKTGEPKKWKAVSTSYYEPTENGGVKFWVPINEIAKNKVANVYIAADAAGEIKTKAIACKAAPKIKAAIKNLASGPSIEITENKTPLKTGYISATSQYSGFYLDEVSVASLENGIDYLMEELQQIADFGGATLNLTYCSADAMTPAATAKLKVPAVANAPKVGLKIAKAFSFKPKANIKYRTFGIDSTDDQIAATKWVTGAGSAVDMKTLFGETNVDGEVLKETMKLQVKTFDSKGKKFDSKINTTMVYASADAPKPANVEIKNAMTTGKNPVTNAAITFSTTGLVLTQAKAVSNSAIAVLEYQTKGATKWTEVKAAKPNVTIKNSKLPDEIYVRIKATDESTKKDKTAAYEAPGKILTIKINKNDPASSTYDPAPADVVE